MPNVRRILPVLSFAAFVTFIPHAHALTYTTWNLDSSEDIIHYQPLETAFGYELTAVVSVPDSVPPSTPYTVTVSNLQLTNHANLYCYTVPACNSPSSSSAGVFFGGSGVAGSGTQIGYIYGGGGGGPYTVTSGAAGTTDQVRLEMLPWDPSGWGSNVFGGNNTYPKALDFASIPVSAATPPTVSIWFQ